VYLYSKKETVSDLEIIVKMLKNSFFETFKVVETCQDLHIDQKRFFFRTDLKKSWSYDTVKPLDFLNIYDKRILVL